MKTFTFLSLSGAASLPIILAAELLGVRLPSFLNASDAFLAFVASSVLLIISSDYSRSRRALIAGCGIAVNGSAKAAHPLAA